MERLQQVRQHLHLIKTQARGHLRQPEISPIAIPALKLPKRDSCQDPKTLPLTAYLSRQAIGVGALTNQLIDQTMELSASLFPSWQQATHRTSAEESSGQPFGMWPNIKKRLPDDALQSVIFPPLAFISAFLIWILFNPMFGQSLPMMCVVFAILSMGAGVSPVKMALPMVICTPIVTLIYWQLLPTLTEMWQLGLVLFVYGFVAAYASKYFAGAKSALIVPFAMICGLSNTQQFAFEGPIVFVVGMTLGMAVTATLYAILWPENVFQKLHQQVNATLSNCARAFVLLDKSNETRSTNEQVFSAIRDSRLRAEQTFVRIEASQKAPPSFDARRLSHELDFMALCVQREVLLAERDRLVSEQGNAETPAIEVKAHQNIAQASMLSNQQDDFRSRCFGLLSQMLSLHDTDKGEQSKPGPSQPKELVRPLESAMSQWKGFLVDLLESNGSTDEEPAISRFISEYASMRILACCVATTQNEMGSLP